MSEPPSLVLEVVGDVARLSGEIALAHYRAGVDVELKADGSPVTIADRAAEHAARDWISSRFPADGISGEEFGDLNPLAARRWILDPIDGTTSFIRGVPLWGTLVALCEGETTIAGAAFFPAIGEMLVAAVSAGCWWNGVRAAVSSVAGLSEATVLTTDEQFRTTPARRDGWRRLAAGAAMSRSWGDCYGYLLVATGRAEVMVDPVVAPWDTAALQRCVVEAGGVFTDWDGRPTAFGGSAVATNAALAASARARLAGKEQ